jgi:hypothetical protein
MLRHHVASDEQRAGAVTPWLPRPVPLHGSAKCQSHRLLALSLSLSKTLIFVGENELGLWSLDRCPFYTAETRGWPSVIMNGSDWPKPASDGLWAWSPPGIEGKPSGLGLFRPGFAGQLFFLVQNQISP